jgi:RING-finger-containing E3 ubiquitin ligase
MASLHCTKIRRTPVENKILSRKVVNDNFHYLVNDCEHHKHSAEKASIVDVFFNVSQRINRNKLRHILFSEYHSKGFLVIDQIKVTVQKFLKETVSPKRLKVNLPMHPIFLCKCGWLLYIPSTLPCGHTMCKHCADENLFCIHCGHTIDEPCNPNLFLVQLLNVWFPKEYKSTRHKKDAKTLFDSEDYHLALNEVDLCISLVDKDYTAYQLRAEIYMKLEEYKSALADSNKSCKLNPDCGKSQFIRGCCFSHLGKLNEAIDAFQLCLELEPEDMALSNSVINKLDSILSLPDTGSKLSDTELSLSDTEESSQYKEPDKTTISSVSSSNTPDNVTFDESTTTTTLTITGADSSSNSESDAPEVNKSPKESENIVEKFHGVPKNLLKEDDFECRLCYELMLKPITTSCGHVFCKNCLLRSLDHNVTCPICRLSLSDFLKDQMKPVTSLIEGVLDLFFNKEYNLRKQKYLERMERMSRYMLQSLTFLTLLLNQ